MLRKFACCRETIYGSVKPAGFGRSVDQT